MQHIKIVLLAVKEVRMVIDPWTGDGGCGGGGTTIKIKIKLNGQQCTTNPILYPTGSTVIWDGQDELNDCANNKNFDPTQRKMSIQVIPTDKNEDYCINEVVVILDDKDTTTYRKETDDEWRKGIIDIDLY